MATRRAGYDAGAAPLETGPMKEWGNNDNSTALREMPATTLVTDPAQWPFGPAQWTDWPGSWGKDSEVGSPGRQGRFRAPWDADCADGESCPVQECPEGQICSLPKRLAAARAKPPTDGRPNVGNCRGWFGSGVVAAACDEQGLRAALDRRKLGKPGGFRIQVRRKGAVSDSAPGVAQAMGPPLKAGDALVVSGAANRPGELLVRIALGRKVYTARFDTMGLSSRKGRAILRVKRGTLRAAGRRAPRVVLVGADGAASKPAAVSR